MNYFSTFVPGLQELVKTEVETKIKKARINSLLNGLVIFQAKDQEKEVKNLCLIEDHFILIRKFEGLPKNPLRLITRLLKKEKITTSSPPKLRDFKLLISVSGKFPFTRKELGRELEIILINKLRITPNPRSKNEFWFFLRGRLGLLGFKITDEKVKYRAYKVKSIPGSLKPQVAHALCLLSEPDEKDTFLDPMCGVATILIERALFFPFKKVLGGDIDPKTIKLAQENINLCYPGSPRRPSPRTNLSLGNGRLFSNHF